MVACKYAVHKSGNPSDKSGNPSSLEDIAINYLLTAENVNEAASSLWEKEDFVPQLIKRRAKTAKSPVEKLIFSFNPVVLEKLWGCPQEYLSKYSSKNNVNDLLDKIIYSGISVWTLHIAIQDLLDVRDHQICNRKKYLSHFRKFT